MWRQIKASIKEDDKMGTREWDKTDPRRDEEVGIKGNNKANMERRDLAGIRKQNKTGLGQDDKVGIGKQDDKKVTKLVARWYSTGIERLLCYAFFWTIHSNHFRTFLFSKSVIG